MEDATSSVSSLALGKGDALRREAWQLRRDGLHQDVRQLLRRSVADLPSFCREILHVLVQLCRQCRT